ncbi:hypothetical protein BDN70DRAFT_962959, partial [Pholiota conissans]
PIESWTHPARHTKRLPIFTSHEILSNIRSTTARMSTDHPFRSAGPTTLQKDAERVYGDEDGHGSVARPGLRSTRGISLLGQRCLPGHVLRTPETSRIVFWSPVLRGVCFDFGTASVLWGLFDYVHDVDGDYGVGRMFSFRPQVTYGGTISKTQDLNNHVDDIGVM